MITHRVRAFNRAVHHENRVHDPDFARTLGFRGGLVPGVDIYAYMTHPVVEAWGAEWLEHGGAEVRFLQPVYDGDEVEVAAKAGGEDRLRLELRNQEGTVCASGFAERRVPEPPPDLALFPVRPLPAERPPASPEVLAATPVLGSVERVVSAQEALDQLAEVGEDLELYRREPVLHPGLLLRFADAVISANVLLPPWMHVSSRPRHFGLARPGERLSARARLLDLFERRGHRFVQLDVVVAGERGPVLRVQPYTAIYEPAFVRR